MILGDVDVRVWILFDLELCKYTVCQLHTLSACLSWVSDRCFVKHLCTSVTSKSVLGVGPEWQEQDQLIHVMIFLMFDISNFKML